MTEEEEALIKEIRAENRNCKFLMVLCILVMGAFMFTMYDRHSPQSVNTNTQTLNSVSPIQIMQERAESRGYYYQDEFAEIQGMSVRTLQRRASDGRLDPAPSKDKDGRVRIELVTKISQ